MNKRYSAWGQEQRQLAEFIKSCNGQYVIEIGCYLGNTTSFLAEHCRIYNKKLIAIDPWDGLQDNSSNEIYSQFCRNTKDFSDVLTVIKEKSQNSIKYLPKDLNNNCSLVFVDGLHTYPGPLMDLINFYPLLSVGGVIAVHDVFDFHWKKDIQRAIKEFCEKLEEPYTVYYSKYYPSKNEKIVYGHDISGLAWIFKQNSKFFL